MQKLKCVLIANFNPRLREGGDSAIPEEIDLTTISIHASAKEATTFSHALHLPKVISIHASAKEATRHFRVCQ